jgi:hypothetical protein
MVAHTSMSLLPQFISANKKDLQMVFFSEKFNDLAFLSCVGPAKIFDVGNFSLEMKIHFLRRNQQIY